MSRRKCTSAIALGAIVFLCALVVTVWVQFSQGAFDRRRPSHTAKDHVLFLSHTTMSTVVKNESKLGLDAHKELLEKTHLDEGLGSQEAVLVKPLKINPDDEHQPIGPLDVPIERHDSGHFRHQSAEIWDPHPKYEIDAFNRKLLLQLEQNNQFLAPELHIVTHGKDFAHLRPHDPKISGCFYTGKIQNDSNSAVAVNLCHGMTGYIRSSWANYYIEPAENFTSGSLDTILHRIKIVPHVRADSNDIAKSSRNYSENVSHSIIEDDFPEDILESRHSIKKRYATFADGTFFDHQQSNLLEPNKGYIKQSKEYFVKVLIVADNTMLDHHKTAAELTKYIMILMSYVALLFKEPSIGNAINVSLVHIRILNHRVEYFSTSKSTDILQRFCDWQRHNIGGDSHDIALLLTRQEICKSPDSCSTLGVAQVSSMCEDNTCTVVRDKGLSTSYTIAHEFGHALSMLHDEDPKCMSHNFGTFHTNNIMSRSTSNDSKPFMWSPCSRQFVTDFLDSPKSTCLLNRPFHNVIFSNYSQMLPGHNFELDPQCELEFGRGQTRCTMPHIHNPPCVHIWCKNVHGAGCITNYTPWAEGTKCGRDSWCYKRECVPQNRSNIVPVDGGWSDWQSWGPCSRSCGGGIKKSVRLCNSPVPANGGNYCTGESVKYVSCNYQNCDDDAMDFREFQCSQFDGTTKGVPNLSQNVQWVPKYGVGLSERSEDLCRLYCKPKRSQAYYSLKDKVIDGTKCGKFDLHICVNGICRQGGCDNILDSRKEFDECGVCGGDNSQCRVMEGTYNTTADQVAYKRVVRIPRGSSNIKIVQYSAGIDENFLALKDGETGQFILNGNQMLQYQEMELEYGHVVVKYSGSQKQIEWITTNNTQRLRKDLIVEVLSIKNLSPPNITYRYMISNDAAPNYEWTLYQKGWTKCSSICEGFQYKRPVCVDLLRNQVVQSSFCNLDDKESATQKRECNTDCRLMWHPVSKSACSPPCGEGYRQVYYQCMKLYENKQYNAEIVDDQHCNTLPKLPSTETCYTVCNTPRWTYSDWSECSRNCGGGTRWRTALKCVDKDDIPIDDSHCNDFPKVVEESCNLQKCLNWLKYTSPCSVPCGGGHQNVTYYCAVRNRVVDQIYCDLRSQPTNLTIPCNEHSCARWAATDTFYPCSVTCGEGVETRRYVCKKFDTDEELDQKYCRSLRTPREDTRKCFKKCAETPSNIHRLNDIEINQNRRPNIMGRYRTFQWIPGEWSQCSQSCDGGTSTQSFTCRNEMGDEDILMCDPHKKPHNIIRCNDQPCPIWKVGDWSPVCDSMCERHRQVRCMNEKMETFDDRQCNQQNRPEDTVKCRLVECPHATNNLSSTYFSKGDQIKRYRWKVGAWKECSTKCGNGVRRRRVECEDSLNDIIVVDSLCKHKTRPKASKGCERYKCKYTWVQGHWSSCSATCGYGTQTRNVTCHKVHQGIVDPSPLQESYNRVMHKNYCDQKSKPSMIGKCLLSNCGDEYIWQTGEWQQCSKACGKKGRQFRELSCINARLRTEVPQHFCPKSLRPIRKRKCNQWRCLYKSCSDIKRYTKTRENKDYVILLHGQTVNVYCYKMDTPEPQEYISLHPDKKNYAEIYDRRLLNLNSCPYGGKRLDNCHCDQIGADRSGMTIFWKVRLNITSMQIISDDFTFSKQVKGTKIPYGTSGDCYSSTSTCPQGQFSVDLTHTSFKLANYVKWKKTGRYSSKHIFRNDTFVQGQCGGYCGGCEPDPDYGGLKVEIT